MGAASAQCVRPGTSSGSFRPRQTPTNSREKAAFIGSAGPLPGAGIDMLTVSFPVTGYDAGHRIWTNHKVKPPRLMSKNRGVVECRWGNVYPVQGQPARVGICVVRDMEDELTLHGQVFFNPSRMIDANGYGLASVKETLDAFSTVLTMLDDCVTADDLGDLSIYKVKRIDVARDFRGVRNPSATIRGLAPLPRKWSRRCVLYTKGSTNHAETLEVGTEGSGFVRLYDKCAETKGAVETGTLRWEVEAHERWAQAFGGLTTLEDLASIGIDLLAGNRWDWSAMGAEVASVGEVVKAVVGSDLKDREATFFLGWLIRQGTPYPSSLSSGTLGKYREHQRKLGIGVADGVWTVPASSVRLDWETGREISRTEGFEENE